MCGIVGYIGKRDATPILIEGLRRVEYRGYDSAGIAVMRSGELQIAKCKGRVSDLENILSKRLKGAPGIAHTRWATHGEPSDRHQAAALERDTVPRNRKRESRNSFCAHFPEIDSLVDGDTEKCGPVTSSVVKFAVDSLLEGDGFELPVPREKARYPIGAQLILLCFSRGFNPRSRRGFLRQEHLSPRLRGSYGRFR
jgi:hypothetical protein